MTHPTSGSACGPAGDLSAYVDGELSAAATAAVAAHLTTCADCAGLVQDLARLRGAARALGPVEAPAHVWLEVAGQIRLNQPAPSVDAPSGPSRPSRTATYQWIGIAASLILTTLIVYYVSTRETPATLPAATTASNAKATATVESVEDDLRKAEGLYTSAIAKLEIIAKSNNDALSPAVAARLQKSLTTIDQAIAESRTALGEHPENASARESLFDALRQKVDVLQSTVALINVMRNGDQAGAANLVGRKSSS